MIRFLHLLKKAKQTNLITSQQYKTIRGQWHSGDVEGAKKGFTKLVKKSLDVTRLESKVKEKV